MPGQVAVGQSPAQGQGKRGPRRQDGGPVQKEIVHPLLAQGAEAREDHGGRQHQGQKGRLPQNRAIVPYGGGVEAGDVAPLLAGPLGGIRHKIGGIVVQRGGAEGVVHSAALPLAAPQGKGQGQTADGGVGQGLRPLVFHQAADAVRCRDQGGESDQQLPGAAAPDQQPCPLEKDVAAQQGRYSQAGQQDIGLPPGVAAPAGDGNAETLQRQQQRGNQGDHGRRGQKASAAAVRRPVLRRLPEQLRFRADGLRVRLGLRLRGSVELLRLLQRLPGEQAPPLGGQQGLRRLLHHRIHGTAHHVLQGHGAGSLGQGHVQNVQLYGGGGGLPQRGVCQDVLQSGFLLRRGRLFRCRRLLQSRFLRRFGRLLRRGRRDGGRLGRLLFRRQGPRPGGHRLRRRGHRGLRRRRGRFLSRLRALEEHLLQTAAELRQNLLQGVVLLVGGHVCGVFQAVWIFVVLGVHRFFLLSRSAGGRPHTAKWPRRRRRSGRRAFPAWGC